MNIVLNGEGRQLRPGMTISELLGTLELTGKRVAVEINGDIAPRSQHAALEIKDGDRIEIVHAIGGG